MKNKLKQNERLYGTMLCEANFPNIAHIFKGSGCDFFIIDCEHGAFNFETVSVTIAVAKAIGLCCIIRIPEIRRECILKYLDMGADGILVPMVSSADDAKKTVQYAKYKPIGQRGVSISRAHSNYISSNVEDYIEKANNNTIILLQIELLAALESIDEIAAVEGIDGLILGPTDLSMDMDCLNNFSDDLFKKAITKIANVAKQNALSSGVICSDSNLIKTCISAGMNIFCTDSEIRLIKKGLSEKISALKTL